jgi:hypothetical protein
MGWCWALYGEKVWAKVGAVAESGLYLDWFLRSARRSRARLFWNQIWTDRSFIPHCSASFLRVAVSGTGFFANADSRILICLVLARTRLMLVLLAVVGDCLAWFEFEESLSLSLSETDPQDVVGIEFHRLLVGSSGLLLLLLLTSQSADEVCLW